ncbi:MAG: tetratricopeptide repeat protein, partial [Thermoanaerobaculia bacterium]
IFSLGIILYEMVTGDRPFAGDTSADLISAILRDTPDSASEVKMDLPHHLGRIIRHCMEKNPKRRYQSALDVRNELEGLRQEIASGLVHTESAVMAAARPSGRPKWLLPAAAGVVALLLVFALWRFQAPSEESAPADGAPVSTAAPAEPSAPSVAVLYFDNLSGDADLEWLRKGLTDMLVTDLSQSPDLRVLSTDRLYQILSDMKKLDESSTSFETVRAVAEEAGADTVILGSYAKLGDTIRISYKIQAASTGEILKAQSADASAQEELFARVDELSREIRQSLELPEQPTAVADRDLTDVSTSSVEAYRYFVEAEEFHYQFKEEEAEALYTKAVEADPTFAMALAKISTTTNNQGRADESLVYAERAMEHLDRLTEPERAYVEGRYYGRKLETVGKAIETYEYTLANYPHITSLSNNLGILYSGVGLLDEAIATLEQGIRYGDTFPGSHSTLAEAYFARGDTARAHQVVDEYLSRFPESFPLFGTRSDFYAREGRLDQAEEALEQGEELRPGHFFWIFGRYSLEILREDWRAAEEAANGLGQLPVPFATSVSTAFLSLIRTYQGERVDVAAAAERAIASYPAPGAQRADSYANWGFALLESGNYEKALEYARKARQEGRGNEPDLLAHGLEALVQQHLGQERRADLLAEELTGRVEAIPGPWWKSWAGEIRGRLALMRGDTATAIAELEQAEQDRPQNDEDNIGVWFHLGTALLEAGRLADAQTRFESIVASHGNRIYNPLEYVRSYYLLGWIHEQQGDTAKARDSYAKFLSYWGDGDLDRERVDHARQFLATS